MNSQLRNFVLAIGAPVTILACWLWMTAVEIEEELVEPEFTVPERFLKAEVKGPNTVEDEIDTTKILEPEPQYGWVVPPEPVRKAAGKVKKRVKKAVKKS